MKVLKFKNRQIADIFVDYAKVKVSKIEEQDNGEVILAYCYDKQPEASTSKVDSEMDEKIYEAMSQLQRYYDSQIEYLENRIDNLYKLLSEHKEGHLPAAKTTTQMQSAIDALGWSNEYDVKKKTIIVSDGNSILEANCIY